MRKRSILVLLMSAILFSTLLVKPTTASAMTNEFKDSTTGETVFQYHFVDYTSSGTATVTGRRTYMGPPMRSEIFLNVSIRNMNATYLRYNPNVYSNDVYVMQLMLFNMGYVVTSDGYFGAKTLNVVKSFQASQGLVQDGIAGPATLNKLAQISHVTHLYWGQVR